MYIARKRETDRYMLTQLCIYIYIYTYTYTYVICISLYLNIEVHEQDALHVAISSSLDLER